VNSLGSPSLDTGQGDIPLWLVDVELMFAKSGVKNGWLAFGCELGGTDAELITVRQSRQRVRLQESREDLPESAGISYRTVARIERIDGPLGGSRGTKEAVISALESFLSAGVQLRACEWMRTKAGS
jgi:hypothetical protein